MSDINTTQVLRTLLEQPVGTSPLVRVQILQAFLSARRKTAERVSETLIHPRITVTTFMSYDKDAQVVCEDVFVETRQVRGVV